MIARRLDPNHDMTFGRGLANYAVNQDAVSQSVQTRLLLLLNEWFLDTGAGVPYLQEITNKPADLALAESRIKTVILETDGVVDITSFSLDFNHATRKLSVSANLTTIYNGANSTVQVTI